MRSNAERVKYKKLPSVNFLNSVFLYNKEDGTLFYKNGRHAGTLTKNGYLVVTLNGKKYMAHRIIYKIFHAEEPQGFIDHKNQNKTDNRIENLCVVSKQGNARNQKRFSTNTSGVCGVHYRKDKKKWAAEIWDKRKIHLGIFSTKKAAISARKQAEIKLGFSNIHGKT